MKAPKQTTWKGKLPAPGATVNPVGGPMHTIGNIQIKAEAAFSVFNNNHVDWLRWDNTAEMMEVRLNGRMFEIDPATIMIRHPLDVGAGTKDEAGDLAAIRKRYECALENNQTLRALRDEYDDLLEKYDILDAIDTGKDNAKS